MIKLFLGMQRFSWKVDEEACKHIAVILLKQTVAVSGEEGGTQFQVEAFLKLNMGRGFNLQPGLVYLLNKHSRTPAFMLRSSWAL